MRRHLTFANVMVVILAFIVLGGGAYAATQLPKNSVGAKQLKKGAVTKAKIKASTLKELRGAIGPAGATGPVGPSGAPGGTIPPGVTLRGVATTGIQTSAPVEAGAVGGISFGGSQLASRPSANIVPAGGPSTASCPGTLAAPEAAAGNVCLYVQLTVPEEDATIAVADVTSAPKAPNAAVYETKTKTAKTLGDGKVARFGFQLTVYSPTAANPQVIGSWAVTGN